MSFIGRYLTIRACVRDLSQRLARRYGLRDTYSPTEVDTVLKDWDMRLSQPAYAYAVFCSRADFERVDPGARGARDYEEYRRDVLSQYPRLASLNGREIAVFARSWWPWSLTPSNVDLPDSFEPSEPPPVRRDIYFGPTLGIPGIVLSLLAMLGTVVLVAFLIAKYLPS
jgi:hypothetical protein